MRISRRWTRRKAARATCGTRMQRGKWKSTKEEIRVSWPASASTWRIAGWQLGSHRHFDFAFLGAFARLGAPLLPSSSHLNATSDPTDGGETRPRTLPSAAPPCFFALSKPGSVPLPLSSFSLCLSPSLPLSFYPSLSLSPALFSSLLPFLFNARVSIGRYTRGTWKLGGTREERKKATI